MDETVSTTSCDLGEKSTLVVSRKRQAAKFKVAFGIVTGRRCPLCRNTGCSCTAIGERPLTPEVAI